MAGSEFDRQIAVERALFAQLGRLTEIEAAARAVFEAIHELRPEVECATLRMIAEAPGRVSVVFAAGLAESFLKASEAAAIALPLVEFFRHGTSFHGSFSELSQRAELPLGDDLKALAMVPVRDDHGALLAVFSFASRSVEGFSDDTRASLEALTAQLGGALGRIEQTRQVNEELRASREMLRTVLDAIPARVFWKDRELRYLGCNRLFAGDAGLRPEEIVGKTDWDLPWIDQAERFRADDRAAIDSGEPQLAIEEPQLGADGVLRRLHTTKVPLRGSDGEILGVLGTYEDVSKLYASEKERSRLATVIEQAIEGVVITDIDGVIAYVNPAFQRGSGYSREEAVGQKPSILRSGKHDALFYRQLWQTISGGGTWTGRLINRRKDGTLYEVEGSIAPILDKGGEISSYVSVRRDITFEANLQRQLTRARQMEVIGTLAGGIAHDFNNLLAGMLGFAEHAHELTANQPAQQSIKEVVEAAQRAKQLVAQILTYSRDSPRHLEPILLQDVLEGALKLLRSSIPSTIEITTEIDATCPPVRADATQMHQLIINLGTNGYQAIRDLPNDERRARRLHLCLEKVWLDETAATALRIGLRPGRYARLSVADTGPGIPREILDRVFEPYFTTRHQQQGTGLGLAIVTGIVEAHDGAITVDSKPGQGTTFYAYLPARGSHSTTSEQTRVPRAASPRGSGQRLLFVDDEPQLQRLGKRLLSHLGYQVSLAGDGDEALELYRTNLFDAVITDLTMPRLTGAELAQRLRADGATVPIVLCTGFAEQLDQSGAAGIFDSVILKPFEPAELAEVVARVLADAVLAGPLPEEV